MTLSMTQAEAGPTSSNEFPKPLTPPSSSTEDQPAEKSSLPSKETDEDEIEYPNGRRVAIIMLGLFLVMFLVALDRTIISTAVPQITNDFNSLGDVGWYGSAYTFTGCSFQLLFGKIYKFYSPRIVLLVAIGLFEAGSVICGASPNSVAFIIGRAVAGSGAAGIFTGVMVSMVHTIPLQKRPIYQSMLGAIFMVSSVVGPLMGGAFTSKATWRWCFYINLPIGAVTIFVLVFFLKLPDPKTENISLRQQFIKLDPLGNLAFMPGVVCLLLALQLGGSVYPWSNGRIIALLVLAAVLLVAFVAIQIWQQENATIPPRIINQRSIASAFLFAAAGGASMTVLVYYIPIWFQAIKGVDPVQSGIDMLPFIVALVLASIVAGGGITRTGYYTPFMIAGGILTSIGAGLISTFELDTSTGKWIGYQAIYGFGLGLGMQQAGMTAQAILSNADIPTGGSLMIFAQQFGGSIFVALAGNLFTDELVVGLGTIAGLDPLTVVNTGATDIRRAVPAALLGAVLEAYNVAVRHALYVAIAMSCASLVAACFVEFKSIKDKKSAAKPAENKKVEEV